MSRLFGRDVRGTPIVAASPAATGGTKAVTQNGTVHFRAGAYRPGTSDGDWLIAHELAHVVQQQASDAAPVGTRTQIEREADRAANLVSRGQPATLTLRAQPSVAYAFSDSEAHEVDVHEGGETSAHDANHAPHAPDDAAADHVSPGELAEISTPVPGEAAPAATAPGGGGPAAKPDKPAPNVATGKPEAGLAQMHGVRPDRLSRLFGQVRTANTADVAKTRAAEHGNPPKQMSTGAATGNSKPGAPPQLAPATAHAAKQPLADKPIKGEAPGGEAAKQAQQQQAADQQKSGVQVVDQVRHTVASLFGSLFAHAPVEAARPDTSDKHTAKMSDADARNLAGSVDKLPTSASDISSDPGPAPKLEMQGDAKAQAAQDRAKLEQQASQLETTGRAEAQAPMGEDHIDPSAPPEPLTASFPAGALPDAKLPSIADAASSEEVGIVAQEQHGAEIDAALGKASGDVSAERAKHTAEETRARAESDTQIQQLKANADAEQSAARSSAQAEVHAARAQWQGEIDKQGADARKRADAKIAEGMAQVSAEQTKANAEAQQHIADGQRKAEDEKRKGEKEAADAKDKAKHKSSGFFGWVASKAKAAFNAIKKAVSSVIDACRKAVKAVIDAAKKLATAAIELARKVIVAAIKAVGDALLAISDVLLAAFPALKAKFQAAIRRTVDKAVATVNKLADQLKRGVQKALDMLGAALDKALGLLEKGINAIIDAASAVVQGAIKAAQAVVQMLGTWAKLIKDVVTGPGAWLGKLAAAVIDGIKNHLWAAFKTAVVEWFKSKVFELLGVGGIILELLLEGGLTREAITQMALDALMVAIPAALVAVLVEKLVTMIVPAAGAVLAVIEGLQAAWGTISRIIAAFSAFMAFLLAVKGGSAGPLFANLLAAAAIVVLDFVANWLLKKLASAARKVGAKLKGLAEKFKAKRKAKQAAKDDKHAKKADEHDKKPDDDHEKQQAQEKQARLDKAVHAIQPQVKKMLQKGVSKLVLKARLAMWRIRYRLSKLTLQDDGSILAVVNPQTVVDIAVPAEVGRALLPILMEVEHDVMEANRLRRETGQGSDKELDTIDEIRDYRMHKTNKAPEGLTIFNQDNLAQYFVRGDSSYLKMEKGKQLPSETLLALERARGRGNVVVMDLADHMVAEAIPGANKLTQNNNMMSGIGAAKAADMQHFVEAGYPGQLTKSTRPATAAQAQKKVDAGEHSRMHALGEIFNTLHSALEAKDPNLLCEPGSPLTELAQAFSSWLRANVPKNDGNVSVEELTIARTVLATKLRIFMRSRRGV